MKDKMNDERPPLLWSMVVIPRTILTIRTTVTRKPKISSNIYQGSRVSHIYLVALIGLYSNASTLRTY